VSTTDRIS